MIKSLIKQPPHATPLLDLSDLKLDWVQTHHQLDSVESENILNAIQKYLFGRRQKVQSWFTYENLLKIHYDMFSDVWMWAGKLRKSHTNIGVNPNKISVGLYELEKDVTFWSELNQGIPIIEQSARIHHKLVSIHPFENGNGRHARLVADRFLQSNNYHFPRWPSDFSLNGKNRTHYIQALKEADQGDYSSLIEITKMYGAKEKP